MHEGMAGGVVPQPNRKPTAAAGADQSVTGPASVVLDGSLSKDSDGTIASYAWEQVSGTAVVLAGADTAKASFDAAEVTVEEQLTFKLTVTDNEGATASDLVVVTVKPAGVVDPANNAPVAQVVAPATANAGDVVVVDASASSDADNDTLTFNWTLPQGLNATVEGSKVTFTAAEYPQDTSLSFTVSVSDGKASSTASATVVVAQHTTDPNPGTCDNAWDASAVYTGGNQVTHAGKTWEAKWWTQGDDPSQSGEWGVWKEVGVANCN